jgi:plasmid stabilization system protein ParE
VKRRLSFTSQTLDDLREIADFITDESGSADVAESFLGQLIARCRRLAELPGTLGTERPELGQGIRSTPHKSYVLFFRYFDDVLEVVGVVQASRDLEQYFGSRA